MPNKKHKKAKNKRDKSPLQTNTNSMHGSYRSIEKSEASGMVSS